MARLEYANNCAFRYMLGGKVITMIGKASRDDPRYAAKWEPIPSDSSTDDFAAFSDSISALSTCS
jgi:hypothetical protein